MQSFFAMQLCFNNHNYALKKHEKTMYVYCYLSKSTLNELL